MNSSHITIREIETLKEIKAVESLQRVVWGIEDLDVVPAHHFKVVRETGGLLIGAFHGDELIGFVYGLLAREGGRLSIHSDMCAVRSQFRDHNLGYRLKLAQREWAIERGIDLITWTFDPLQARNANLNFRKLGASSDQYRLDYYGESGSFLHQLGTDRFWVRWDLRSERTLDRLSNNAAISDLTAECESERVLIESGEDFSPRRNSISFGKTVLIEIPGDIDGLQKSDRDKAILWRSITRAAFTEMLAADYVVVDFHRASKKDHAIGIYELRPKDL